MKEISKKELMNQILESQIEMDEMAGYNPGREDKNPWDETPEERVARGLDPDWFQRKSHITPLHFERPPAKQPKSEKTAPDMFVYRDPTDDTKKIVVVQRPELTMITEEQLKEENPKFHSWAKAQGKLLFLDVKKRIMHDPLEVRKANPAPSAFRYREQLGLEFPEIEGRGEMDEQEKILRGFFNDDIRELAESVNEHLVQSGMPPIATPDAMYQSQSKNINKHSTISNESISWSTENANVYDTVSEYLQNARDLYRGREAKMPRVTHLVRRNNPGKNWEPCRKLQKKDDNYKKNPKTEKLGLDLRGYAGQENEYDVEIVSLFTVTGGLSQNENNNASEYKWTVEFSISKCAKRREDTSAMGFVEEKRLVATATSGRLDKLVGSNGSISSNKQVVDALRNALDDIKNQILEIDSKKELKNRFAGVGRTEAFREVNESIDVDAIVSRIIKEIKQ
jgi:hypothetical protein